MVSPNIQARPKVPPTIPACARRLEPGVYVERHKNKACDIRIIRRNGRETVDKRGWDVDDIIQTAREKAVELRLPLYYRHVN